MGKLQVGDFVWCHPPLGWLKSPVVGRVLGFRGDKVHVAWVNAGGNVESVCEDVDAVLKVELPNQE